MGEEDRSSDSRLSTARRWRAAVPLVGVLAGLLFAVSAVSLDGGDRPGTALSGRRDNLPDLVAAEQDRVAQLGRTAAALRAQVDAQTASHTADPRIAAARAQITRLSGPVGLSPAAGRAVTVVLDDAPRGAGAGPFPPGVPAPTANDLVVHQQDVQGVVNALWAGGASAMTIMGQRVIALTAIRCVGNTLLLHGLVYSPPFTVTAIGDQTRLRAALDASKNVTIYRQYVGAYGLGYDVTDVASARLPAYTGSVNLPLARPLN
ncbi:MAG: DUF881 domain-containing protein [Frankia sp.]